MFVKSVVVGICLAFNQIFLNDNNNEKKKKKYKYTKPNLTKVCIVY